MSAILNFAVKYYGLKENVARKQEQWAKRKRQRDAYLDKDEYMRFAEAKWKNQCIIMLLNYCIGVAFVRANC